MRNLNNIFETLKKKLSKKLKEFSCKKKKMENKTYHNII